MESINEIFKIFYFYAKLVFDDKNEQIKESQQNIKQTQLKLKEKIVKLEKEISVIDKRIEKFQNKLDNSTLEDDLLEILLRNIKSSEDKMNTMNIELSKSKIDYELQNEKFNQTLLEMTYYDIKEKIVDWFTKSNVEEQRNELIRTIKTCKIFGHYIIIDTGNVLFFFNINQHYVFDMKLLDNLNKDEVYKEHFIELKNKKLVKTFNDKRIVDIRLSRNTDIRMRVFQYLTKEYKIVYDIGEHTNFVSFVPLTGIMSLELEEFGNEE